MTEALETKLVRLRDRVALQFGKDGEDMAQEMVIRMILSPELTDLQVMTKAKWLFRNRVKSESRYVLMDDEELGKLWSCNDTNRIHAGIELRRLMGKHERVAKLVKVMLGRSVLSRVRICVIRSINRDQEPESL